MSYLNTLKGFAKQFQELANFKDGDQITVSEGKLTRSTASSWGIINAFSGQDSEGAIQAIGTLFQEMKKFLETPSKDPSTLLKRLKRLDSIKKSIQEIATNSLSTFKTTCQQGKAAVFTPSASDAQQLGNKVEILKETLLKQVQPLIEKEILNIETTLEKGNLASPAELIKFLLTGKKPQDLRPISQTAYSAKHVTLTLTSIFGKSIVENILSFYQLDTKSVLKIEDIKALLIGIKANLTEEDILHLLNQKGILKETFPELLSCEFQDNETMILKFLDTLRNTYDRKEMDFSKCSSSIYKEQLERDLYFLDICDRHKLYGLNKNFTDSLAPLQHYGASEFLAKDFIFGLYSGKNTKFREGVLFPCYTMEREDKDKKLSCLQAWPLPNGEGVYPALILPLTLQKNGKANAKIIFRGIDDEQSKMRALEFNSFGTIEGAGAKSFNQMLPSVREALQKSFTKLKEKFQVSSVEVECLGYSLGASDAARFLLDLITQLTTTDVYPSLKLFAFNTPCIGERECMDFLTLSDKFPKMPIHLTYFKMEGDIYQQAGLMLPGYFTENQTLPNNVSITVVVLNRTNSKNSFTELMDNGCGVIVNPGEEHVVSKHAQRCFTPKDVIQPEKNNPTYLVGIYTNHKEDATLSSKAISEPSLIPAQLCSKPGMMIDSVQKNAKQFLAQTTQK